MNQNAGTVVWNPGERGRGARGAWCLCIQTKGLTGDRRRSPRKGLDYRGCIVRPSGVWGKLEGKSMGSRDAGNIPHKQQRLSALAGSLLLYLYSLSPGQYRLGEGSGKMRGHGSTLWGMDGKVKKHEPARLSVRTRVHRQMHHSTSTRAGLASRPVPWSCSRFLVRVEIECSCAEKPGPQVLLQSATRQTRDHRRACLAGAWRPKGRC